MNFKLSGIRLRQTSIIFCIVVGMLTESHSPLSGQEDVFNHPELSWETIETEHFVVHFHNGTKRTAALVSKIGEEIYEPITTLYDYIPDTKIHFIIKDYDDYANGAAFYYDNKIEFWAPAALDFPFRGSSNWLRNTITHEFSHMISLGSARKFSRQIQAVYFQWLDYEKEKRKDVIHGYPSTLVSIPYPGTIVPMWFAEGMAQFQRTGLNYEKWDSHRDMLLRTAVLANEALSIDDMGYFGKNSLGNERVYGQGYGFTLFLASKYGESGLKKLDHALGSPLRFSFSKAAESAFGKSEKALFKEWMDWLKSGYTEATDTLILHAREGRLIDEEGLANFYPAWSPDGIKIAYLSSRGMDYLSQRSLWIYNNRTGERKKIKDGISSSVTWSPDGSRLAYARHEKNRNRNSFLDLFIYDLNTRKETQVTHSRRARQPDWSRDGRSIVCVVEEDGQSNLALVNPDGKNFRIITPFGNESLSLPRFMPDGRIVFAMSEANFGMDIAVIDSCGSGFSALVKTQYDERDPWPAPDGRFLYYSSDKSGIFNIYRKDLETGEETLLTNTTGGAFMPAVNSIGECVFSRFDVRGFKLAVLDSLEALNPKDAAYESPYARLALPPDSRSWSAAVFDDRVPPSVQSRPYRSVFQKFIFLPRVFMDFPGKLKIGTYCYNSDFLDKFTFFGGAALNSDLDTDLFGVFEYKRLCPTLFLELYQVHRQSSEDEPYITYDVDYTLLGSTLGARWKIDEKNTVGTLWDYSRYRSSGSGIVKYQNVFFKFASTYHKGSLAGFEWKHRAVLPAIESSIAPRVGRFFTIRTDYAMQSFYDSTAASSQYGTPVDIYNHFDYFQTFLDWHEFFPGILKTHSMALRVRGGYIDRPVDPFYHFYAGGLDGMRGYPYYSMEGRKLLHTGLGYLFPVKRNIDLRLGMFYFKDAYLSLYGDIGNAWISDRLDPDDLKKDAGIQLRMNLYAYYGFPMKLAFDAAYGMDRFKIRETEYGKEWRFYFTLLFDFLDLTNERPTYKSLGR